MSFIFLTLFKELIEGYFSTSILNSAIKNSLISTHFFNIRDYTKDRHKRVDAPLIGGGAGMVMSLQPIKDGLLYIKKLHPNAKVIFTTPSAKPFMQNDAKRLSYEDSIIFVCGRYEGIDERAIEEYADEVFSIGDYILTGGELASLVMCDAISRHIDGVVGNSSSLENESFSQHLLKEPTFSKLDKSIGTNLEKNPNLYPPSEYLKGNHAKISALKKRMSLLKTKYYRPESLLKHFGQVEYK